ncbi:MAG: glycosyltransferase family 1 protein [bacterium]|nr:glycosyltransferase family 1 protein [bacterium]
MKIGIDYHWGSGIFRGTNTYVTNLLTELTKVDDINQYFLFSPNFDDKKNYLGCKNFAKRTMPINSGSFNMLFGFSYQAVKDRIDIFHSQYIVPITMHCKRIVTIHDIFFETHLDYFPRQHSTFLRKLTPLTIKKASKIITVSEFTKNELMRVYNVPSSKIKVIWEGVNKKFKQIQDKNLVTQNIAKYGIDTPYILYVGRIVPIKNITGTIKAFYRIKKNGYPNLKLVIVGEKDNLFKENQCFKVIQELHLEEHIIFLERIDYELLIYLYNGASAFVLPSFGEGFGLPVIEAMACGTPVITSNVCALPEIAGDAAILVNPHNTEEIADAIEKVLNNALLQNKLIIKGIERAKNFSWRKCAEETLQVYKEVYEN